MALPTIDEFLDSLRRMRTDAIQIRDAALAEGDKRSARTCEKHIAQIERMILKKGGTIE